ncbi:MAG TPA: GNAT family N-acetyltransferase [Byssovorax sp.]
MDDGLVIRPAVAGDAARLGELAGGLVRFHHATDPRRFLLMPDVERGYGKWLGREAQRDGALVLVAAQGDEIVGYGYATLEARDWDMLVDAHGALRDVFVDDAHRRAGVGARLLDALLAELDHRGAPRVLLSTMVDNEPAKALFASRGFRPTMVEMTRGG